MKTKLNSFITGRHNNYFLSKLKIVTGLDK